MNEPPEPPVSSEPVSSEPVSSEPVSSEPASSEPVSSEPVSSEPVSSEPVSSERVLAEGRLHPRWIAIGVVESIGRMWLAFLVALLNARELAWIYLPLGIVALAGPLIRYFRFRYRLTPEALEITDGVFARRERRIPLDRVQDVSQSQSPLRRMLGIMTITVETASSAGAEGVLDGLTETEASALRLALREVTRRTAVQASPDDGPLHCSTTRELLWLGFTDNRAGVLVLGALIVLSELSEMIEERLAVAAALFGRYLAQRAEALGTFGAVITITTIVLVVLFAGWLVSAAITWIKFAGFTLREYDGVFQRKYGLLTTRQISMPRRYLQILRLEQSAIRRLLRLVVIRADNAGSALDPKGAQKSGVDVFVPVARPAAAKALVPRVFPGADPEPEYRPTSSTLWQRWATRGGLVAGAAGLAGAIQQPSMTWLILAAVPLATLVLGLLAHRNLGWAIDGDRLAVRWGIFGLHRAWMPRDRVQSVDWVSTPLDRWAGVVHLRAIVTGGGQLRVGYLKREDAHTIADFLAPVARHEPEPELGHSLETA